MEETNDLIRCVRQYRDLDNEVRALNTEVYKKREARKIVEIEMADLVKLPAFSTLDKLRVSDDGTIINIEKPGSTKAWSLSKKDLKEHLQTYTTRMNGHLNVDELYDWILREQSKKLVTTEYSFTRIIKE